jgi:hypothetical protein
MPNIIVVTRWETYVPSIIIIIIISFHVVAHGGLMDEQRLWLLMWRWRVGILLDDTEEVVQCGVGGVEGMGIGAVCVGEHIVVASKSG